MCGYHTLGVYERGASEAKLPLVKHTAHLEDKMTTKTRTALATALALAAIGTGPSAALADTTTTGSGAAAVERIGSVLKPATAKQKREIRRQLRHARKTGKTNFKARPAKSGAKKQSRWYTPLGCIYFSDATLCGSDTYFDVSYQIYWANGYVTLGYMPTSTWNTLVYYYG